MENQREENESPRLQQGTLQDVFRLAVTNMPANPEIMSNNQSHVPSPMDSQRREWLTNVLTSLSSNSITEEMKKAIKFLQDVLELCSSNKLPSETVISINNTLDELVDHSSSIDNANDFEKMGGFHLLPQLLNSNVEGIQWRTADLIAELVQNNPHCQNAALQNSVLKDLLDLVDSHDSETVRIKALYALSCLIRQNTVAQGCFENADGFSVLLRGMQSNVMKLRIKISFLLNSLCTQQAEYRDLLYQMGFVEQIIGLLHSEHDDSHEYLIQALLSLVKDHPKSRVECRRNELELEKLLISRLTLLTGQESSQEEFDYCEQLLNICFKESLTQKLER